MASYTFQLTGNDSILRSSFFPPLEIPKNVNYNIGMVYFSTYNSIHNITKKNNVLSYLSPPFADNTQEYNKFNSLTSLEEKAAYAGKNYLHILKIPEGAYELEDIYDYIEKQIGENRVKFDIDMTTQKCHVNLKNIVLYFDDENSIGSVLGIDRNSYTDSFWGQNSINICDINCVNIYCNLVSNSYVNGEISHILHSFALDTPLGYKINEIPNNIIYLPINEEKSITYVEIKILDQLGRIVDFNKEQITILIHLKPMI